MGGGGFPVVDVGVVVLLLVVVVVLVVVRVVVVVVVVGVVVVVVPPAPVHVTLMLAGMALAPLLVAWKPKSVDPPVPSAPFHDMFVAVTAALPAAWVQLALQPGG